METLSGVIRTTRRTVAPVLRASSDLSATNRQSNDLHQLMSEGRRYVLPRHQIFQSSDDRFRPLLNMIKSGYVKRYEIGNDGSLSVQAIYGPGDIFPLTLVFKNLFDQDVYEGPEIIYYETINDAELFSQDINTVTEAVSLNPVLYRDLLYEAGVRTHSNIQRLENLALKGSLRRTAHQLAYFARQFGDAGLSSIKLKVLLTHQDIADVLSVTRETVSLNLRRLQQKNLIKPGRYMEIPNLAALEDVAYGRRST